MRIRTTVRLIAALAAVAAVPAAAGTGLPGAEHAGLPAAEAVAGNGPWGAKMACVACAGGILVAGGSSIVGLIAIIMSPGGALVGACAGVCTVAFS